MTNPIPRAKLLEARLAAAMSAMTFSMREAANAMDALSIHAHEVFNTEEFRQCIEEAQAALAAAGCKAKQTPEAGG